MQAGADAAQGVYVLSARNFVRDTLETVRTALSRERSKIKMKTCKHANCIANFDGECVAGKCRGEIIAIDLPALSRDQAVRHYNMAAEFFKEDTK